MHERVSSSAGEGGSEAAAFGAGVSREIGGWLDFFTKGVMGALADPIDLVAKQDKGDWW